MKAYLLARAKEPSSWHVSIPNLSTGMPRRQALIIDKQGTRLYA